MKHRIDFFRVKPPAVDLQAYPLFPFDENDVKEAVETGVLAKPGEGAAVTIRQLSVVLHKAISDKRIGLSDDFDIAKVSSGNLPQQIIRLAPTFAKMVA